MRASRIMLLILAVFTSILGALGDDDEDDCEFIKSLSAKSEVKSLEFSLDDKVYSRDYCARWRISASKREVIIVNVLTFSQRPGPGCKDAYLKLVDNDNEIIATTNKQFAMKGPQLLAFLRPKKCLTSFKLTYKSSTDYNPADDDEDNDSNTSIGGIIGGIVGGVLAVLLIVLVLVFAIRYTRKRREDRANSTDNVSVHFWSKPSGYSQPMVIRPSTSTDAPHEHGTLPFPPSSKPGAVEAGYYASRAAAPPQYLTATVPSPPPYSGHPTTWTTETSHLSDESPPSYTDAIQKK